MSAEDKEQPERYLVVGLHRTRLSKIMKLVDEREQQQKRDEEQQGNDGDSNGNSDDSYGTFISCLAAMDSYEAEDGSKVRYMTNFVLADGSPMTKVMDDEELRNSVNAVLMVGYEWKEGDSNHIQRYLSVNSVEVPIVCVEPNPQFKTLQEEMSFIKNLPEEERKTTLKSGAMGPKKMANFVLEQVQIHSPGKRDKKDLEMQQQQQSELGEEAEQKVSQEDKNDTEEEAPATQSNREPIDLSQQSYACKMCRTPLFGHNHLAEGHVPNLHSFRRGTFNSRKGLSKTCQSLFCDESVLEWLSPHGQDVEGKLVCPKCSFKVGSWNWSGAQCSCGTWVTPGIQIPISKVDIVPPASSPSSQIQGVIRPVIFTTTQPLTSTPTN